MPAWEQTPPLATPRLRLVGTDPSQAAALAVALADPRLYDVTGGRPPTTAELRVRAERPPQAGAHQWTVLSAGEPVGFVQATLTMAEPTDPEAELAWVIGTPWQGRGYAAEAATAVAAWVAPRRRVAHIAPGHLASEAVARRLGLAPTGVTVEGETRWQSA